jgi:probable HAF family extracellular repeat protein
MRIMNLIGAGSLLAALAVAQTPTYTITDLGTFPGGATSYGFGINNAGMVAGSSNAAAMGPQHAFIQYGGQLIDLGTLGGAACPDCNSGADGPNAGGEVAIGSETSTMDPNGEDFCEFGTHHQCLGAIWRDGFLTALPNLLGGNNANAFLLNDQGEVVGFAENGVKDSTCVTGGTPSQVFQFEAVRWSPTGQIQELQLLPGDTVGFAFGINDRGQAVGASGLCSNTSIPPNPSGAHAVLWDRDGTATDLGNLGTMTNNVASSINNRGEVVGTSQSSKDGTIHAFLWTKETGMQDLGAYPGAVVTVAACCDTINDQGQIVGFSVDGTTFNTRALIWLDKVMMDLNTLIPAGSPWYLQSADSINNAGEIVGQGLINGNVHAFLATPSSPPAATNAVVTPVNLTTSQSTLVLDGSGSTSAAGSLQYLFVVVPGGKQPALLQTANNPKATVDFVNGPGLYLVQLIVTDANGVTAKSPVIMLNYQPSGTTSGS